MKVYLVKLDWSTEDGNDVELSTYGTYEKAYEKFKELIANEMNPDNLWVGELEWENGVPKDDKIELDFLDRRNDTDETDYNTILIKQPKFFIAENVKGILSLGKGSAIKQIVSDFEAADYIISVHLVNMADYGVPQTRQRVIIVGQRIDLGKELHFRFPKPTHSKNGELLKWVSIKEAIDYFPDPNAENAVLNHIYSAYKVEFRNFTGHRKTDPDKPSPTILARGNGQGGVCAIPHYNGKRRLTIRESASIQTFPENFHFLGAMNSCYRQIGNADCLQDAQLLADMIRERGAKDIIIEYYDLCTVSHVGPGTLALFFWGKDRRSAEAATQPKPAGKTVPKNA